MDGRAWDSCRFGIPASRIERSDRQSRPQGRLWRMLALLKADPRPPRRHPHDVERLADHVGGAVASENSVHLTRGQQRIKNMIAE